MIHKLGVASFSVLHASKKLMKTLILTILDATAFAVLASAQTPAAAPKLPTPPPKLTAKDIRVYPFAQEHKDTKFKPNTRELPDELIVTRTDRIRIYGKRRIDGDPTVRGVPTGNLGQVALLPLGNRKGTLFIKRVFGPDFFFAVLELSGDSLNSTPVSLKEGKTYIWSVNSDDGRTTLKVIGADGIELSSSSAQTDKVLGVGFAATVRHKGNEVDMTITYE